MQYCHIGNGTYSISKCMKVKENMLATLQLPFSVSVLLSASYHHFYSSQHKIRRKTLEWRIFRVLWGKKFWGMYALCFPVPLMEMINCWRCNSVSLYLIILCYILYTNSHGVQHMCMILYIYTPTPNWANEQHYLCPQTHTHIFESEFGMTAKICAFVKHIILYDICEHMAGL